MNNEVVIHKVETKSLVWSATADDAKVTSNEVLVLRNNSVVRFSAAGKVLSTSKTPKSRHIWTTLDEDGEHLLGTTKYPTAGGERFPLFVASIHSRTEMKIPPSVALGNVDMPTTFLALSERRFLVPVDVALGRTHAWLVHGRSAKRVSDVGSGLDWFMLDAIRLKGSVYLLVTDFRFTKRYLGVFRGDSVTWVTTNKDAYGLVAPLEGGTPLVLSWSEGHWNLDKP